MKCEEAPELITGLVDDELSAQEQLWIRGHLTGCTKCQSIYSEERVLKRQIRETAMGIRASSVLKNRIIRDQHLFLRRARLAEIWQDLFQWPSLPRAAVVAIVLILAVVPAFYSLRPQHSPIAPGVLQSYTQISAGDIKPTKIASMVDLRQVLARSVDGRFAPMGYDFSSMDLRLVGGLYKEIAKRKVLVTVYEGNDSMVICYTFLGSEDDAPSVADAIFDSEKGTRFYRFSHGQINAVMYRAGEVMCVLVSQMPMGKLLALARSKAPPGVS